MAPIPIENLVKEKIPIVSNAVLVGDRAKFLSILLTLKVTWVCCPCMGRSGRSLCPRVQRAQPVVSRGHTHFLVLRCGQGVCVVTGYGDEGVLRQCEVDRTNGEPLDKLSLEAIHFCRNLGSHVSTVSEILELQDPLVYKAIQRGIDAVNQEAISNAQRIHKWAILEKDFSVLHGELGEQPREQVALALGGWSLASVQGHMGTEEMCPLLGI